LLKEIPHNGPSHVFAFTRETEGARVLALFNFSSNPVSFTLTGSQTHGTYLDGITQRELRINQDYAWEMEPHGYRILILK
jgi:hypothetical protein